MKFAGRRWLVRGMLSITMIVTGVWLGLCALLYVFQESYVYYPSRHVYTTPAALGFDYEDVELTSTDGNRIHGWWLPAADARGTVLFLHGNAGNIASRLSTLEILYGLGLNTLIMDYQGYGNSDGRPGEQATYDDARAAWEHLVDTRGIAGEEVIIFGRSLGGAIAAWLASEVNAAGLIMESTFTSIADMGREIYPFIPVTLLARIHYPVLEYVENINMPVLVIHSETDELIPYTHAQRLYNAANEPRFFQVIEGGHNEGFLQSGGIYRQGLNNFIEKVVN
ncbi:MAG: alpha/beta hydrolase [Gammaproteobacteria bacterium]